MPIQKFFSYIMARTSYFQWDDDEFRFVLDQYADLDFYSAFTLKQQSTCRHVFEFDKVSTNVIFLSMSNTRKFYDHKS
jgi:hypothetical protein